MIDETLARLTPMLSGVRRLGVAYSGGVDSSVLLGLAARVLGSADVVAVLGVSASLAGAEREAAHDLLLRIRREPSMATTARGFELVKTPHHGSSNLDDELMASVRAPIGVISVGADNDYGHPSPRHLDVLRRNGYAVFRTDQRGDVAVVRRGGEVVVVTSR